MNSGDFDALLTMVGLVVFFGIIVFAVTTIGPQSNDSGDS